MPQKITLVFADLPANTHLKYDVLVLDQPAVPARSGKSDRSAGSSSSASATITYLLMAPGFEPADWARINDEFFEKHMEEIGKADQGDMA